MATPSSAAHWAVIVAGSNGYGNYRHQADACHAYQLMKKKGIPESNIILLAYDDIANNRENPFKGKLFNKPDPHGPGVDVYEGCNIDYKGRQVTPTNFVNVLTGKGDGKVLKSTADDHVFVTFFDHGAPGLIAFPGGFFGGSSMHKVQLQQALQTMSDSKMFSKLVFYLESCESGSMFEGMNIANVYALSAANPKESSWGAYCGSAAKVNGKNVGSCLGDLFSVNWMEDDDAKDTTTESLETQFEIVKAATNKSHVMQWGDLSLKTDSVSEYIGNQQGILESAGTASEPAVASAVSAREVDLHRWYWLYNNAETGHERLQLATGLQAELKRQQAVESAYRQFAAIAYPGDTDKQKAARRLKEKPDFPECEMAAHDAFLQYCSDKFDANSGFAMQFHQVVVNVCADIAHGLKLAVVGAVQQACAISGAVVV